MYSALSVAKHIIQYCNDHNMSVSNLKLQKLLYFVQAEFLVNTNKPCFFEEIGAWDFGPVVPEVYHYFKIYGSSSIPCRGRGFLVMILPEDQNRINAMVNVCAKYSAAQLVDFTHKQTPWIKAYAPYKSNIISKRSIKDFFSK